MDTLINHNRIKIFPSADDLFADAAADFVRRARHAVTATGQFTVVLSGGNTVKSFFDALTAIESSQQTIPWQQIKFFFGDERYVAADDAASNYHTAQTYLFSKVPVSAENIYRIPTELGDPTLTANSYEVSLRKAFNLQPDEFPKFDLVYLGLGEDAHTASLMPFSAVVKTYSGQLDPDKNLSLVTSIWVEQLKMYRITLTPPAINHSDAICFLVTGANKASAVRQTLQGSFEPEKYPAQLIECADKGKIIWWLDEAAAGELEIA